MRLVCIEPSRVPEFWSSVAHYIATAAVNVGLIDVATIHDRILKDEALLWLACDDSRVFGAGVTQLINSCGTKVCEIIAWGSDDQDRCQELLGTIEKFARVEGCTRVRLMGRRGWVRKLPGFAFKAVILEKVLS